MKKGINVCLIDDDKIYVFAMNRILKNLQLCDSVVSHQNPELALEAFANDPNNVPDIIMVDINMPVMDGWQFLRKYEQLSEKWPKKPSIYLVSSSVDEADLEKVKSYQMLNGYLTKPIGEEKLRSIFLT